MLLKIPTKVHFSEHFENYIATNQQILKPVWNCWIYYKASTNIGIRFAVFIFVQEIPSDKKTQTQINFIYTHTPISKSLTHNIRTELIHIFMGNGTIHKDYTM